MPHKFKKITLRVIKVIFEEVLIAALHFRAACVALIIICALFLAL